MDPLILFLIAALTGMGAFAGWFVKWAIAHLESDVDFARQSAERGTGLAEKGAAVAEQKQQA